MTISNIPFKKKAVSILLVLFICIGLTPDSLWGQGRINYLHLKEFFRDYEERLKGLAPPSYEIDDLDRNERRFAQLFYNNSIPIYNFLVTEGETQTTLEGFLQATREFRNNNSAVTDAAYFYLDDFEVIREKRNGLLTVRLHQHVEFSQRLGREFYTFSDDLYFTLLYTNRQEIKILRIDRVDYPLADGLGSGRLVPSSVEFFTSIQDYQLLDQAYSGQSFYSKPGADIYLRLNYDIYGKARFNMQLSPALFYSRASTSLLKNNIGDMMPGEDRDGQSYGLIVAGERFGHTVDINFFGFGLNVSNIWHRHTHQIRLGAGLEYMIPFSNGFELNAGGLEFSGQYTDLLSEPLILENIEAYGFTEYNYNEFANVYEPQINNQLSGNVSLQYGFRVSPDINLFVGPSYHFAFSNLISSDSQPVLLDFVDNEPIATAPNLLAYGDQNRLSRFGFSASIIYQLKRPNLPYRTHVSYSDVRSDLSRLRRRDLAEEHGPINVYVINSYARFIQDKDFNRDLFSRAVESIVERKMFSRREEVVAYIAFDDSLFVGKDGFDLRDLRAIVYNPISEGLNQTTQDFENFRYAMSDILLSNRRVIFHMILASPYSYADAHMFIENFANTFLQDDYRFAEFYLYTPFLRFHERRVMEESGDPEDIILERLMNTLESAPKTPYNFDYNYERIEFD